MERKYDIYTVEYILSQKFFAIISFRSYIRLRIDCSLNLNPRGKSRSSVARKYSAVIDCTFQAPVVRNLQLAIRF
jgi:hypothetical protein